MQAREQRRILSGWLNREVRHFSPFWAARLRGIDVRSADDLSRLPAVTEAEVAGAGGPGNPALLLRPDEQGFKRHAPREELWAAAGELSRRTAGSRRGVIFRRYQPVHVHEAGVDRLVTIAYTRSDLDRLHLAGARLAEVVGVGASDALLNLVPAGPSIHFWGLYHMALAAGAPALHPRGAGQAATPAGLRGLGLLPATVLALPSDEAQALLIALSQRAAPASRLRLVLVVGEPPTAADRSAITAAASDLAGRPVRVQAVWAPEVSRVLYGEAPPAAGDPPHATYGFLTYPDLELLEVRDPATDRPAPEGELVVTSLGWRGTAMVRYATGSWVGGIVRDTAHPVTGATVPRLSPEVREAAWQPRIGGERTRPDLRAAYEVLRPDVLEPLAVTDWSLRPDGDELVLGLDTPLRDRRALGDLALQVGRACGVVPTVRVGRTSAGRRPQVGSAGPRA